MKPFAARAQLRHLRASGTCASRAAFVDGVARRDTQSLQLDHISARRPPPPHGKQAAQRRQQTDQETFFHPYPSRKTKPSSRAAGRL